MEYICTKEFPYTKDNNLSEYWQHPDAVEISEKDIDYSTYVTYKCPYCNLQFEVELPN